MNFYIIYNPQINNSETYFNMPGNYLDPLASYIFPLVLHVNQGHLESWTCFPYIIHSLFSILCDCIRIANIKIAHGAVFV